MEVRNSTDAVDAEAESSRVAGFNEFNLVVSANADVARILSIGMNEPERLTDPEWFRYSILLNALFNHYRQVHKLHKMGKLSEVEWLDVAREAAYIMNTPGGRVKYGSRPLSSEFWVDVQRESADWDSKQMHGRSNMKFD